MHCCVTQNAHAVAAKFFKEFWVIRKHLCLKWHKSINLCLSIGLSLYEVAEQYAYWIPDFCLASVAFNMNANKEHKVRPCIPWQDFPWTVFLVYFRLSGILIPNPIYFVLNSTSYSKQSTVLHCHFSDLSLKPERHISGMGKVSHILPRK